MTHARRRGRQLERVKAEGQSKTGILDAPGPCKITRLAMELLLNEEVVEFWTYATASPGWAEVLELFRVSWVLRGT